jgi:hypothetical protein
MPNLASFIQTAAAVLIVLTGSLSWAQSDLTAPAVANDLVLPFNVALDADQQPILVLGVNTFTPSQLARFLAGLDTFLERAGRETIQRQVVWQVDGERGYISISTTPFDSGPAFLLTLRGEEVRGYQDEAALLVSMTRLASRVLTAIEVISVPAPEDVAPAPAAGFNRATDDASKTPAPNGDASGETLDSAP